MLRSGKELRKSGIINGMSEIQNQGAPDQRLDHHGSDTTTTSDPAMLIYTAHAKVYSMAISSSPRSWNPITKEEVPISFYFDKQRNLYRILSYDGSKLVINSTILPSMSFVKPSSAFGLWMDTKLRTIFGLGFSSKKELEETSKQFDKVVKASADLDKEKTTTTTTTTTALPSRMDVDVVVPPKEAVSSHEIIQGGREQEEDQSYQSFGPESPDDKIALAVWKAIREQSARSMKQEEEREHKVVILEKELTDLKMIFNTTHDSLMGRVTEGTKLLQELRETKSDLEMEKDRAGNLDNLYKQEKEKNLKIEMELKGLRELSEKQSKTISSLEEQKKRIDHEMKVLKELLRSNVTGVDTEMDKMENLQKEINKKMDELDQIRSRVKKNVNFQKSKASMIN